MRRFPAMRADGNVFLRSDGKEEADMEKMEKNYRLFGDAWEEEADLSERADSFLSPEALEQYRYFVGDKIAASRNIAQKIRMEGETLYREGRIVLERIRSGHSRTDGRALGEIDATGMQEGETFPIRILFARTEVTHMECGCPKCRKRYYSWYAASLECPYTAGTLQMLQEYLNTHTLGDATDERAKTLLRAYQQKRVSQIAAKAGAYPLLQFVPRLIKKNGNLMISFKIGEKKLFVVKKPDQFCRNVRHCATETYGSSTQIHHDIQRFTEKGKGWIHFLSQIVREEEAFQERMAEYRGYAYRRSGALSELKLSGWRLDAFYKRLGEDAVEFEDRDAAEKKKRLLFCAQHNPDVSMRISAETYPNEREFHGVQVTGSLPKLYYGTDAAYYLKDEKINRVDPAFLEKIEPLVSLADGDCFSFHIGRNAMSEFFYRALPQLAEVVEIMETEPETFRKYLLPEAKITFYLDMEDQNVTCMVYARYGEKEVSALDRVSGHAAKSVEPFRDAAREEEAVYQAMQLLPEVDPEKEALHCGGDEELVYQMMEGGVEKLMELGEVRCTKRFLSSHAVKPVKVSVGVSVSCGLLELDIATDDVSKEELLAILDSYRAKKRYYRMKDGSFASLGDASLGMLAEMMDAAQIGPGEFAKGKMRLPMYRTLYLDRMLEEHEGVCSRRDSHFREVVKGFKTIKDADFEEPESLSAVMRNYQKNGYKWLRTLEAWQFGGILADDMGLGKTLQVIAVLLAAKREGGGTSLVISPASLVFNWGEEIKKFAPELSVSLITGTQKERQGKLRDWKESDVLITSYDLLKRDIAQYEGKRFSYEIIDEAQYIKNHATTAAKAVKAVQSRIRYALTGTPIENRLSELWSIFDYLMPGFLYGYETFRREIETPVVKNGDKAAMRRLQKMVGPFILRRRKEDVLKDLPKKLEECRYVKFERAQQRLYDGQVLHMKERLAGQNDADFQKQKMQILSELTRLRQICCDPSLCFAQYKGGAAKLDACLELLKSAIDGGHRILLFSQFKSMLEILQTRLMEEGISYVTITGSTPKERRLLLVKEFNEGSVPVFLISLKAGGVGLNLTGADVVIHYDPWWNFAVQNQATDRAHRIGQTKKVTVYKLIARGTVEEKIQKLQEAKKDLAEQVMGSGMGNLLALSRKELLELLEV